MTICQNVYFKLKKYVPDDPPEMGGLFGGRNGVITSVAFDQGVSRSMCSYTPDVNRMNAVIEKWNLKGMEFLGIFHTHFLGVRTLSEADKKYIKQILNAMPEYIVQLYFPIMVLPERDLIPYVAISQKPDVLIQKEELIIL